MKRILMLLAMGFLLLSAVTATMVVATPVAGGTVSYTTQGVSGFVSETTFPNSLNRISYFGYQSKTDSSPVIFFQGYYDVEYVNGEPKSFHGFDETTGDAFVATVNEIGEDPQYRAYSIYLEFPSRNTKATASVSYRTYAGETRVIPVWPRDISGAGMTSASSAEPYSSLYPGVFSRWVSEGGIANNLRKHLLGIGVLPASAGDIDFLRSELKASQDQLAGAGGQP